MSVHTDYNFNYILAALNSVLCCLHLLPDYIVMLLSYFTLA